MNELSGTDSRGGLENFEGGNVNSFTLKMIAIAGMTADHIGTVFSGQIPLWLECLLFLPGGMTFPIMAFMLTEGYRHTSNVKRYGQRLFVFALVSLIPFRLAVGGNLNVLFTLLLGLIVIYCYDNMKTRAMFWLLFAGAVIVSAICDWGIIGVMMILIYHAAKDKKYRVVLPVLCPWLSYLPTFMEILSEMGWDGLKLLLPSWCYIFIGCSLTIPLLLRYNGERGYKFKWGFYIYYPAHLLALAVVYGMITGDWWSNLSFGN
jgi:hypothetical protein